MQSYAISQYLLHIVSLCSIGLLDSSAHVLRELRNMSL